ncbi:MAG: epoxyqueuosine reductase QueH [Lachnospiraceae bacterium]|nr:epoxyqueuosine reductase QueH [Lachnospiraceae bacterium]MBP5275531.1 epoxyqueuosine reductase QueH [Lachnospiraceae bacterium]MBP5565654.1 epoxyqueuosine reductase QueH [Lachnospiraceae bacterium]
MSNIIATMNNILSEYDNPRLLLHSCCAPCSSYCLLCLREFANITTFFYNPNITNEEEYIKRRDELLRLIEAYNNTDYRLPEDCRQVDITKTYVNTIDNLDSTFEPKLFFEKTKGLEACPERGERCSVCFELRLRETAIKAKENGYDLFATTLTLSPLKNAELINEIGGRIGKEVDITYLPTDFKKKNGYKMSIELSKEYNLYRQNYCGCVYSQRDRQE